MTTGLIIATSYILTVSFSSRIEKGGIVRKASVNSKARDGRRDCNTTDMFSDGVW